MPKWSRVVQRIGGRQGLNHAPGCRHRMGRRLADRRTTRTAYWQGLARSRLGARRAPTLAPVEDLVQKVVAEVKGFDPSAHFDERQLVFLDRVAQLAVVAAREAIAQSGISLRSTVFRSAPQRLSAQPSADRPRRMTTIAGSTRRAPRRTSTLRHTPPDGERGRPARSRCIVESKSRPSSRAPAPRAHTRSGTAFHMVRSGRRRLRDHRRCGSHNRVRAAVKVWEAMRFMAPDACRPFSKDRKGMVLGEGAAISRAGDSLRGRRRRGAGILGEIIEFGMSADADGHYEPCRRWDDARNSRRAPPTRSLPSERYSIRQRPRHRHAANDVTETRALQGVFGAHAKKARRFVNEIHDRPLARRIGRTRAGGDANGGCARDLAPPTISYLGPGSGL